MSTRWSTALTDSAVLLQALLFGALSWIVPKRRGVIAFYPSFEPRGYSGNLRPVFERMVAAPRADGRPLWLTRSGAVATELAARGLPVHRAKGRPLWTLLRADLILIDSTEPRIGFGRFRIVQAWHGSGIKRIGLEKEGRTWMRRVALRANFKRYVLIVAGSTRDATRKAECFANGSAVVIGTPRNDALVSGPKDAGLAARLGIHAGETVITYCPTYREDGRAAPFTDAGWRRLEEWAVATNAWFLLKRHVRDKALQVPPGLTRVRDVTADVPDLQALLGLSHVLVTDYSSVSTDFALTKRPVIFFTYDAAHFAEHGRGLYDELTDVLPGPFATDETALLALLADRTWADDPTYRAAYDRFRATFHTFADDRATERLVAAIRALHRPAAG